VQGLADTRSAPTIPGDGFPPFRASSNGDDRETFGNADFGQRMVEATCESGERCPFPHTEISVDGARMARYE
jgi:hypothetical protein